MDLLDKKFTEFQGTTLGVDGVIDKTDREPGVWVSTGGCLWKDPDTGERFDSITFNVSAVVKLTEHSKPKKIRLVFDLRSTEIKQIMDGWRESAKDRLHLYEEVA